VYINVRWGLYRSFVQECLPWETFREDRKIYTPRDHYRVKGLNYAGKYHLESFAGLIPIRNVSHNGTLENPKSNASMFFWYFPAQERNPDKAATLIWLQGGPGSSSMIGLFYEMGPLKITKDLRLEKNYNSWNKDCNMIFIDNPVGTGFSFVHPVKNLQQPKKRSNVNFDLIRNSSLNLQQACETVEDPLPKFVHGYTSNQAAVAHDIIIFLDRFYQIFPELIQSDLFLTGESYAGKYVPAVAYHIDKINKKRSLYDNGEHKPILPLRGIAVGNGLTDPITQVKSNSVFALALGLVSKHDAEVMDKFADLAISKICEQKWEEALEARENIFSIFDRVSGGINHYDIRRGNKPYKRTEMYKFLDSEDVKESLNIPKKLKFHTDPLVAQNLATDIMKSAKSYVSNLLDANYTVLLYQGQFDIRDGILGSTEWIDNLKWYGNEAWQNATREIWYEENELAGYYTRYNNLVRVEVLGCGHLCPGDNGNITRQMISEFLIPNPKINH
jgi:vitellogenic carboxypeptidase-like protein